LLRTTVHLSIWMNESCKPIHYLVAAKTPVSRISIVKKQTRHKILHNPGTLGLIIQGVIDVISSPVI